MNVIKIIQNSMTSTLFLSTALLTITSWGFSVITSAQNAPIKQETIFRSKSTINVCTNFRRFQGKSQR